MYKAKNGLMINDSMTPAGFEIRTAEDILTALYYFPAFQTVTAGFIFEALTEAIKARKEYANITDLAEFLAANYI